MSSTPIYLDNNSSTPIKPQVLDVLIHTAKEFYGNPSSQHFFGWQASAVIEAAADKISKIFNCDSKHIVFTGSATEANNLILRGLYKSGFRVSTSRLEHSSVLNCIKKYCDTSDINFLEHNETGIVTVSSQFNSDLISIHHSNNEIGSVQGLAHIASQCNSEKGTAFFHTDFSQSLGKIAIPGSEVDALTISAHKCGGPKGVAALVIRNADLYNSLNPIIIGGSHQNAKRAGTLDTPHIAALAEAVSLADKDKEEVSKRVQSLSKRFLENLNSAQVDYTLLGPSLEKRLPGNLSLHFHNISVAALLSTLSTQVAFSTGSACQNENQDISHVLEAIGLSRVEMQNVMRIGIGYQNTENEIDRACELIIKNLSAK